MSENASPSNLTVIPSKGTSLILSILALSIFAILGNAFNLPLFFSVDFIFGSIATFIALRKLDLMPAMVVGLIGSAYTMHLWGHPYAFIIFTAEILAVGLLRRYIRNLVYADVIFWIGLGVPLIWIFYSYYLGADENSTNLIILKQPLNGIFNAICASLFLNLGAIYAPQNKIKQTSVNAKKLTTNILLLLTLTSGAFPLILDSYRAIESREAILEDLMENYSLMFFENPETGQLNRYISLPKADKFFNSQTAILKDINLAFVDQNNKVIYQQGEIKSIQPGGKIIATKGKMKIWHPDQKIAGVLLWAKGEYFLKKTVILDDQLSYMIISQSAQPIVDFIKEQRLQTMISLLILLIGALIVSHLLSTIIVGPIQKLDAACTKFKTKFGSKQHFSFPESRIAEYKNLALSLNSMAKHIRDSITREEALRNNLEARIKEKTNELERLSCVASDTTCGVSMTDPDGKVEWINDSYTRQTGYGSTEVIGQDQQSVLRGPATDIQTSERMTTAFKQAEIFNDAILYYRKNQEPFWAEIISSPIYDTHHQITGYIIIQNDVTERVTEREALVQKLKNSDDANVAKSELLATMSHEIRTPLSSILGLAQLIADSGLNPVQTGRLKMIQFSGQSLLTIINDVLDIVNIEAGEIKLKNTSFNLNNLLSTCISGTNSLAHEKGLQFHLKESGTCPSTLVGDSMRLRQILWNLASHAVKSTSKGSIIVNLDCSGHQFDEKVTEKRATVLHLSVSHTHEESEKHLPQQMPQNFSQNDKDNQNDHDRFKDAGPSIKVVQGLVDLMNGTIDVTTQPNKNVTYDVYLPFNKTTTEEADEIESNAKDFIERIGIGNDILVAEDNPTNAMIARAFLEKNGQNVRIAENGMQAMAEVRKKRPDLIFMDAYMPEMNGMEVTEKLRRTPKNNSIPIIGFTAEVFTERLKEFLKSGMDDVITKPFTEIQLQQAMVKFLAHKKLDVRSPNSDLPIHEIMQNKKALQTDLDEGKLASIGNADLMDATINSIGPDTFNPILEAAPNDVRNKINQIEQAVSASDFKKSKEVAHSLIGISSSLFATELQELAKKIELDSDNQDVDFASIEELKNVGEETILWWGRFVQK